MRALARTFTSITGLKIKPEFTVSALWVTRPSAIIRAAQGRALGQ